MQICCPQIFGKRRHSGEMSDKSQLKAEIFNVILRHWCVTRDFTPKDQQTWLRKRLRMWKSVKQSDARQKVDQMVKIYISFTKNTLILYFYALHLKHTP